jgi:hypothetical protein
MRNVVTAKEDTSKWKTQWGEVQCDMFRNAPSQSIPEVKVLFQVSGMVLSDVA